MNGVCDNGIGDCGSFDCEVSSAECEPTAISMELGFVAGKRQMHVRECCVCQLSSSPVIPSKIQEFESVSIFAISSLLNKE